MNTNLTKSVKLPKAYRSPFKKAKITVLTNNIGKVFLFVCFVAVGIIVAETTERGHVDSEQADVMQQINIVDGDTLDVDGRRIRLYGIDAPEKGQPCTKNGESFDCGEASKQHLAYLLTGERLTCNERSKDRWGRSVAICMTKAGDIAALMVRHGWAVAYREYSKDYVQDEEFARVNELGLWAKDFILPKEWRKGENNDKGK
ncbi:MAG: thermonuclease family protein [Betaproteobacteria bacterium]|nr:thermonuclease family protein [Betaproteobacteria bacterium]